MRRNYFFVFLAFVVLSFSACQKEEIFEQEVERIIITMSVPSQGGNELKSASMAEVIQKGDTLDIYNLANMNVIFSAENQKGEGLPGIWTIFLKDCDNDTDDQALALRPQGFFTNSNLASIKPSVLGLYFVNFQTSKENFSFYLRHFGLPGTIGDDHRDDYSFRMEKIQVNDFKQKGEVKQAYTLYLRASSDEFKSWGESNGINPNNPDYWQALLFCGGDNFFTLPSGQIYNAKNFSLRRCRYTANDYVCFTFFPDEVPPMDYFGGGKVYRVQFYAGKYGGDWWTFSSSYQTGWNMGLGSGISFSIF